MRVTCHHFATATAAQDGLDCHRAELSLTFTEASHVLGIPTEIGGRVSNICPASLAGDEYHPVHRDGHAKAVQFQRGANSGTAYPEPHAIGEAFSPLSRIAAPYNAVNSLLPVSDQVDLQPYRCACARRFC